MIMINAADEEVNTRLWAQTHHQPTIMVTLVRPIQTGFNESFWQVFTFCMLSLNVR